VSRSRKLKRSGSWRASAPTLSWPSTSTARLAPRWRMGSARWWWWQRLGRGRCRWRSQRVGRR